MRIILNHFYFWFVFAVVSFWAVAEPKDEIAKIDKKIDKKVYELSGLTEEEIKVVEGK